MFENLDSVSRAQAARYFRFILEAMRPLTLVEFSFLDEGNPNFALELKVRPLSPDEITYRYDTMERRLRSRCKGLLETSCPARSFRRYDTRTVNFFHRSVRDYLVDSMSAKDTNLVALDFHDFNAYVALSKASIVDLKSSVWRPSINDALGNLRNLRTLDEFLHDYVAAPTYYIHLAELSTGQSQQKLLETMNSALSKIMQRHKNWIDLFFRSNFTSRSIPHSWVLL